MFYKIGIRLSILFYNFVLCVFFLVYVYVYRYVGGWVCMPMHAEAEHGLHP